jgi:hypothetical protein
MRTGIGAVVLAGAAVLAIGPGTASSAVTAKTWTVSPGGAITAKAGKSTLLDTKTGVSASCQSSLASGTLKAGSGLAGTGIGSVTSASFVCHTPFSVELLQPRGLPWTLDLASYNPGTGVARGTIGPLALGFSFREFSCRAVINGTSSATPDGVVAVSYSDKTGKLTILPAGGNLHWYHVHQCAGLVNNGDPATLSASYVISPAQTITSP